MKPIPGSPSKPSEPVIPSLPTTPSPPVRPVIVPLDHALPAESDRLAPERLFRDGLVTRSGRQVKLTEKAKAAFQ